MSLKLSDFDPSYSKGKLGKGLREAGDAIGDFAEGTWNAIVSVVGFVGGSCCSINLWAAK